MSSFLISREKLAPRGIGKSIPRREDARLLTGVSSRLTLPANAGLLRL